MKKWFKLSIKNRELVYCENDSSNKGIMYKLLNGKKFKQFNAKEFFGAENIADGHRLYYDDNNKVWQICGRETDRNGCIIPNTYAVREVGEWGEFPSYCLC